MTAIELRNFILQNMTAEEALLKFIQTSIEHYDQLKVEKEEKHEGNPLFIMIAAAMDLGWTMAIEKGVDLEKEVDGIILGTDAYMQRVLPEDSEKCNTEDLFEKENEEGTKD